MVTLLKEDNITAGGVKIDNHLILAAGILGTTGASLNRILNSGAGAVVTKSIGPFPKEGHKGPCVCVMGNSLINAMGLPNPSSDFKDEIFGLSGKPVIASIFGGNPEEFSLVASWFKDIVRGFELNVSCPHAEGYGAQIGCNPDMVLECTKAVAKTGLPVWVKLTPNVTDITQSGIAAQEGGACAVVAINTVKAMRISTEMKRPVLGNKTGGLSGHSIFPIAVRCVWDLYEALDIPVIGCGGVSCADNVIEMMMAGAQAVEIGSSVIDRVDIFENIKNSLYSDDGEMPVDIIGCAHE
ncbi:dihydroorotate dehydrogenase (NAD+) catalytic subunit [Methanomicrobium sp. W14]|uniref:dihydroorotate dehydrogenase n=1 Tax=Methanomicrobium sp. W14 TaxID=2817839 RepID=UPI001AE3E1B8|nr:dihydroorotate dehydrogenase [Methanomicrobium sp. W14]MBP2132933.1 dihydroorotate dehydrogenase (NAD+) catalytic subunit [Methanomicrobium sp. W14]